MRSTRTVTALTTAGLAAAVLVAGGGAATAQTAPEQAPTCIEITIYTGKTICLRVDGPGAAGTGSLGYGSAGTGSLSDVLSQLVVTGSNVLSLELPLSTGSLAPGSTGSYGPEASLGELSATSTGQVIGGSLGF